MEVLFLCTIFCVVVLPLLPSLLHPPQSSLLLYFPFPIPCKCVVFGDLLIIIFHTTSSLPAYLISWLKSGSSATFGFKWHVLLVVHGYKYWENLYQVLPVTQSVSGTASHMHYAGMCMNWRFTYDKIILSCGKLVHLNFCVAISQK